MNERGREKREESSDVKWLSLFRFFPLAPLLPAAHPPPFPPKKSGWAGWGVFTAAYAAAISLLLPGVAAVPAAGFVFGFWRGLLAAWAGGAAGQVGAFLLSRYLLGAALPGLLRGSSRLWASVDAAMGAEGWKLLLLLRLSPAVPYNLLNLAAAATSVRLLPFALASAAGIVPECALLVYVGEVFFFFRVDGKRERKRPRRLSMRS